MFFYDYEYNVTKGMLMTGNKNNLFRYKQPVLNRKAFLIQNTIPDPVSSIALA